MNYLFIKGNVPSSKNSKVWTGKFLISSKACREYEKATEPYWYELKKSFKEIFPTTAEPRRVGMYFVRKSKHKFDYINACQILADLMTDHGWIEDDNADYFIPVFLGYHYDKDKAGVYLVEMPNSLKLNSFLKALVSEIKN